MTLREEVPAWAENGRYHNTHTHTHTQLLEMMFKNKTDATRTSKLTLTLGGAKISPLLFIFQYLRQDILSWVLRTYDCTYHAKMLLLLLSRFSRVRLLVTPWTAAYQAPASMGFSRQEYWSGCHCLLHAKMRTM